MTDDQNKKQLTFLSLKWKVVFGISVALIAVNVIVAWVSYQHILLQSEQNRQFSQQAHIKGIEGIVKNSSERMRQLSYLVPLLQLDKTSQNIPPNESAHNITFVDNLREIIQQHASLLQIEYGLNSLYFFDDLKQPAVSWGGQSLPDPVMQMVADSLLNERPQNRMECHEQCNLYTATPILYDNGKIGVIVLSASMVNLVVEFSTMSDADIGVIAQMSEQADKNTSDFMELPQWHARLLVLSNARQQFEILKQFTTQYSLSETLEHARQIKWQDRSYELQLVLLSNLSQKNRTMVLVISDITRQLETINKSALKIFYTGLLGLLISEVLLLFILWAPMRDIGHIVKTLPLFAKNAFPRIREELNQLKQPVWVYNEIDLLAQSVFDLSLQLEDLKNQVDYKTRGLIEHSAALAKEKDFITGLLNTSQAIILTQDRDGKIVMMNAMGQSLLESGASNGKDILFDDILSSNNSRREVIARLQDLRQGKRQHLQHESDVKCNIKNSCIISWFHSRLSMPGDDGAVMLSVGIDVTDRKEAVDKLEWIADHDPLTHLYNRRRFQKELENIIDIARQYGRSGALLYFDVDHFKYLNDTQGHQAGDRMLILISKKLRSILKRPDIVARLGGDEFAVILAEADEEIAISVAKRIINSVRSIESNVLGGAHNISVSIGIVIFPNDGLNVDELLSNADMAMYQVKQKKRGEYHLFSSDIHVKERLNQLIIRKKRIEKAIKDDQFVLYFQPILDIRTNKISRYETLIRMVSEDGSIQMPDTFIPEAEQLDLIGDIDRLVIKKAIKALSEFNEQGYDLSLSINLSGKAMDAPDILKLVQQKLDEFQVEPSRLIIEVTETAAVSDIVGAERLMHEINELGCHFALDDFGVGFSSFFYLKQLPVDFVKIDGMFIRQLPFSDEDQIFVKALNEMAHGLGKQTVAEFVENEDILKMLKEYGVDYAQGYYIGKPLPDIIRDSVER